MSKWKKQFLNMPSLVRDWSFISRAAKCTNFTRHKLKLISAFSWLWPQLQNCISFFPEIKQTLLSLEKFWSFQIFSTFLNYIFSLQCYPLLKSCLLGLSSSTSSSPPSQTQSSIFDWLLKCAFSDRPPSLACRWFTWWWFLDIRASASLQWCLHSDWGPEEEKLQSYVKYVHTY